MNQRSASITAAPLAPRLRNVHVGLRNDLEVSRHLFRGEPSYVVRDPMTFHSRRLNRADYHIYVNIEAGRSLGETFDGLVKRGKLRQGDEEHFYNFIISLHQLGFLRLPLADDKLLYRRYQQKRQARRRDKLMTLLFLRIPLWNPDAFLSRTVHFIRALFTPLSLAVWMLLVAGAVYVACSRWDDLKAPIHGVLVLDNLPLLWLTLVFLKCFHEMGHAYACKLYGAQVPEMGVYLIVLTPCAYMDASASWGFTAKWRRIVVCLSGMYVELAIAAVAVFVWALTGPSPINALAYNVIFLASVVTLLFNINPLARFDGYYVLSDLLEVPNLRQRAKARWSAALKKVLLGVRQSDETENARLSSVLLMYGVLAAAYRVVLVVAIGSLLLMKMYHLGLIVGALVLARLLYVSLCRLTNYLLHARETAPVRGRALLVAAAVFVLGPLVFILVPMRRSIAAPAVVGAEHDVVIRAPADGILLAILHEPGDVVRQGEPLVLLHNDRLDERLASAAAEWTRSHVRKSIFLPDDAVAHAQEDARLKVYRSALDQAHARLVDLEVRAPRTGRIVQGVRRPEVGSYVQRGQILMRLAAGHPRVRALLTDEQASVLPPGQAAKIAFRPVHLPGRAFAGHVVRIAPTGSRQIDMETFIGLTHAAGGPIPIDTSTALAARAYFQIDADLVAANFEALPYGVTGYVRFSAPSEPLLRRMIRPVERFWDRLQQD